MNDRSRQQAAHAQAQAQRLRDLEQRAADRPAHARFLAQLRAVPNDHSMDDLPRPAGVSSRVAIALIEDLSWCRTEPTGNGYEAAYPAAYSALRLAGARAAAARRTTGRFPGLRLQIG